MTQYVIADGEPFGYQKLIGIFDTEELAFEYLEKTIPDNTFAVIREIEPPMQSWLDRE